MVKRIKIILFITISNNDTPDHKHEQLHTLTYII
jgi:hypothetical protein